VECCDHVFFGLLYDDTSGLYETNLEVSWLKIASYSWCHYTPAFFPATWRLLLTRRPNDAAAYSLSKI